MEDQEISKRLPINESDDSDNAWEDPDDNKITVDLANKARLRKIMRKSGKEEVSGKEYSKLLKDFQQSRYEGLTYTRWAEKEQDIVAGKDDEGETRLAKMLKTDKLADIASEALPPNVLEVKKYTETPYVERLKSVVQSIDLHPTDSELMMVGGFDKTLKFFKSEYNPEYDTVDMKMKTSLFFDKFPIKCAKFYLEKKDEVILSSIRKHFIFFDLQKQKSEIISNVFFHKKLSYKNNCIEKFVLSPQSELMAFYNEKNNGMIGIMQPKSRQLLFDIKMNESVSDLIFSSENELITTGDKGFIYIWDIRTRRIVNRIKDHGAVKSSAVAFQDGLLAVGSSAGVVNLYDFNDEFKQSKGEATPIKTYTNLTTEITDIQLSKSKLSFSSKWEKGALKIANNIDNCVYKNWPNFKTKISLINTMVMSPVTGHLYLGEDTGMVKVYQLN